MGLPPEITLLYGFKTDTESYAVVREGRVVAVMGVGGELGGVGYPWMMATDELKDIRKSFLSQCREFVRGLLTRYSALEGHVWAGNRVHIKWLLWTGFKLQPASPHGINDQPFHRFHMKDIDV